MKGLNYTLVVLLLLTMGATIALRPNPTTPNIEILPDMVHSAAYASFAPNPVLPGGMTIQAPVAGTLPRGFQRLHYTATPEDAVRAGEELKNPLDPKAAKDRGAVVYQNFCTPCHGGSLRGDGPVPLHGYPAPPNLRSEKSMKLAEGQMFHILTYGQKNMPSHATQLSVNDRWSVISHVRALQSETAPAAAVEATK